jgi:ribose 5-phosphate isomerase B
MGCFWNFRSRKKLWLCALRFDVIDDYGCVSSGVEEKGRKVTGKECGINQPSLCIAIASDHAGYRYKERIKAFLTSKGHRVQDFGTHSETSVDYPLFIRPAAEAVARGECEQGIVLGGSGNGEAMVANKVKGIRCAVCWNAESARLARQHNNANVISLGQRLISPEAAQEIVETWLSATFEGGRHERRIKQIESDI